MRPVRWRQLAVGLAAGFLIVLPLVTVVSSRRAVALSETQRGVISQNCGSIQQSLRQLQVADSRTRVYLGSIYEVILSDYMSPLATRVANNNLSLNTHGADLITQQSDFAVSRSSFSTSYIEYQRALEGLVAFDCRMDPDGFYARLESVREQRADLAALVAQMRTKLEAHVDSVQALSDDLEQETADGQN